MSTRREFLGSAALFGASIAGVRAAEGRRRLLYAAVPGIRNYLEWGGIGVLVFDIDQGHKLVKRIPTFDLKPGQEAENVKGVAANARTGRLYVSTIKRLACLDLLTERMLWNREYPGGCDRMALAPDGKVLYLPSLEGPHWNVVDALSGELVTRVTTNSGAHNTVYAPDGSRAYLAGLKSPYLNVAETERHTLLTPVGPFSAAIRPFTINRSQTLAFVNVNDLLGFEWGDLKTRKMLGRVEVAGYSKGMIKRHGCPSHGIGLTPDEREIWLCDGANSAVHVFDVTDDQPKQGATIKLRDQPGWVTFSMDGRYAYPSTGEVIDAKTKRIVATLSDEEGRPVQSEKMVEIIWEGRKPIRAGDQFGIGRTG